MIKRFLFQVLLASTLAVVALLMRRLMVFVFTRTTGVPPPED